jgi:hypothetical protein
MTNPERALLLWIARNILLMLARSGGSRATERGEARFLQDGRGNFMCGVCRRKV